MKMYRVSAVSKLAGGNDNVCVMAESVQMAFLIGKPMLNTHKLIPAFLNGFVRYDVEEI